MKFVYGTITFYGSSFQKFPLFIHTFRVAVLQPLRGLNRTGLGYSPFARHYLGNHYLFSLPPGT